MVDSEEYGADDFSSNTLKNQLYASLKFETELNCVIIIVSFGRFRNGLKDYLAHLLEIVKTLGLEKEHTLVIFTHCEGYEQNLKEKYVTGFNEYYGFIYLFCQYE